MILIETIENCTGCALCADVCPHNAITMAEDENGYVHPKLNKDICEECGVCERKCIAIHPDEVQRHSLADEIPYAAWTTDNRLIRDSASGGIFAQAAVDFLETKGARVYGAALTEQSYVRHIGIERREDITLLQNSKYQQSDTSGIYRQVLSDLKAGKRVLFSGTPCQVAALYKLAGDNANLFTAELVCHGVPSNYLAQLAVKLEGARRIAQYRTKSLGWEKGNRTVYAAQDGTVYEKDRFRNDFHFRAYLSFAINRKSCRKCPFARAERVADITLGDFWGLNKAKYGHFEGVSVVLVNSAKGRFLTDSANIVKKLTTWEEITRVNQNLYMPTAYYTVNLSDKVHLLKKLSLWKQKLVLQNGVQNRYVDFIYQKLFALLTINRRVRYRREGEKRRKALLDDIRRIKPKAGILTTYFAANFGAMLQPFALKRVLENEGCDVELIRYKQKNVYDGHLPISMEKIKQVGFSGLLGVIAALPFSFLQYRRLQHFKREYLQPDDSFEAAIPMNKDYYFFGSDQIWNPKNTGGFDEVYFGNFKVKPSAKKIAYAASGERIAYTETECSYLKKNLQNFDAISVREKTLKQQLEKNTGVTDIEVVLDPTLLATQDILNELPCTNPLPDEPFVFFYQLRKSLDYLSKIHGFARSKRMKLVIISSTPKKDLLLYALKHKDVLYKPSAGMDVFLGCERFAEYVFTPSFHGCAFAIIYHKHLFALQLEDGLDTRVQDLLCLTGMRERCVHLNENWTQIPETDYSVVEAKLEQLRTSSMKYIRKNLKQK